METDLTHTDLHEIVWSEPIKNVAPKVDISDVAISKICRKHVYLHRNSIQKQYMFASEIDPAAAT